MEQEASLFLRFTLALLRLLLFFVKWSFPLPTDR